MVKIRPEHRWIIIGALCGVVLSITIVFVSFYISPNYVAKNLSTDGILEPITIFRINLIRIGLNIVGILLLSSTLLFLYKPYLLKLLISKLAIRNNYLSVGIWFFSIITLIFGLPRVINSINNFHLKIDKHDEHTLRLIFHGWYRRQHSIMEFIKNNIPNDEPLLIDGKYPYFFAYYLAPRPFYKYSDIFAEELDRAKRKYYVLNMIWDQNDTIMHWSIVEWPDGNIIIKKTESYK